MRALPARAMGLVLLLQICAVAGVAAQTRCVPGPNRLCLDHSRFAVEVQWQDAGGQSGLGNVVPFKSDSSGMLWFFGPDNWEMLVKVLDGCAVNNRFWVFSDATTNVRFTLSVTDTVTGAVKVYRNRLGHAASPVTDTNAFAGCAASPAGQAAPPTARPPVLPATPASSRSEQAADQAPCAASSSTGCLAGGRFRVSVSWRDGQGQSGSGQIVPFGTDNSMLFYFFSADDWEMLVKVLDGCSVNQRFWVFAAATTDVEYTLTVADTFTGGVNRYTNPLGHVADAITDSAAFSTCDATGPSQISFVSGANQTLTGAGQQAGLAVKVVTAGGLPVPGAAVSWASSNPGLLQVAPNGPLGATVTALAPGPGSSTVTATYQGLVAQATVAVASAQPSTFMVTSDLIVQLAPTTLVLRRNAQTEALQPNQVLVSVDGSGVLARIEAVTLAPDQVSLQVVPAAIPEAYARYDVDATGEPIQVTGQLRGNGAGVARLRSRSGRVVEKNVLDGASCTLDDGSSVGVDLTGAAIDIAATLTPHGSFHPGNASDTFSLYVDGDLDVTLSAPQITLGQVSGKVTCSLQLPALDPVQVPEPPFIFSLQASPTIGLTLDLTFGGPTLTIGGPVGRFHGTVKAGVAYSQDAGWSLIAGETRDAQLDLPPPSVSPGGFTADVRAFGRVDLGLNVSLGIPYLPHLDLVTVNFASLEAYGDGQLGITAPLDSTDPAYTGPTWALGAGIDAALEADLSDNALTDALKRVGVETSISVSLDLFHDHWSLKQSPTLQLTAAPGQIDLSQGGQFAFQASSDQAVDGTVEFDAAESGVLAQVAQAPFSQGAGSANWTPGTADVGAHAIRALLRSDDLSDVLPYASNSVQVTVLAGSGGGTPPAITGISPDPVPGIDAEQVITLFGSNFAAGATVNLADTTFGGGATGKPTVVVNSGQLTFMANVKVETATWTAQVVNPDGTSSSLFSFQVQIPQGPPPTNPQITSISPNPVPGIAGNQMVTFYGSNFAAGATVNLADTTYGTTAPGTPTSFVNSGQVSLSVNTGVENATWTAVLVNPDGTSSNTLSFQVQIPQGPPPTNPQITSISPNPVPGIAGNQTVTLYGSNFAAGATVNLADTTYGTTAPGTPTSFVNSGQVSLSVNTGVENATWTAVLVNPDGTSSNTLSFQVQIPQGPPPPNPQITSISPNPVPGIAGNQTVTLYGSNFVSGATVNLVDTTYGGGATGKATNFISSGQLTFVIDTTAETGATWTVQVVNPGGSASPLFYFPVEAPAGTTPAISGISPSPVPGIAGNQTVTLNGSNFVPGATVNLVDTTYGGGATGKATNFINSGQLTFVIDTTAETGATWTVQVVNPGGSASPLFYFPVEAPAGATPAISSISPSPVPGIAGNQTVTLYGSNFAPGATVNLVDTTYGGGATGKATSFVNSGQLTFLIDTTVENATWTVVVVNPDQTSSTAFYFQVQIPQPQITAISPNPVPGIAGNQTVTLYGSNFAPGATVNLVDTTYGGGATGKATNFISSGQLTFVIDTTAETGATWTVQVVNPGGSASTLFYFPVE